MKFSTRFSLYSVGGLIALAASTFPVEGQAVWNDSAGDSSWSDTTNWTPQQVPGITGSPADEAVQIGTMQSGDNTIILDTGAEISNADAAITIGSLAFNSTLNSTSVNIAFVGNSTMTVAGSITNNTAVLQSLSLPVIAGANGTYAGGTGGLTFDYSLDVGTYAIATSGVGNVTGNVNFTLNASAPGMANTSYGTIGPVNTSNTTNITVDGSYTTTATAASDTGDFFRLTTGTFSGATAATLPALSDSNLTWVTTLIQKGILLVDPSSTASVNPGATVINSGVVLPIGNDSEFNPAGGTTGIIVLNGGELLTANNNTAIDYSGGATYTNGQAFSTTRAITINTVATAGTTGGTLAATTGTVATYGGVISDAATTGGTPFDGALVIGDSTNTGTVVLTAANTHAGPTTITAGSTLQLGNANASQNSTVAVNAANGLKFSSGIGTFVLGGLSGAGNEALADTAAAAVTLQVGKNNANTTYSGILSGTGGALAKMGTGTLTLGGANTYTGGTTVTAGTLAVNGSTSATGTVAVGTAGTLAGTGTIGGATSLTGGGVINLNAGTIAGGLAVTGGNWNGTGTVGGAVTASSGILTLGSGSNLTANGGVAVTGTGSIAGTGTVTGNINYTSGTGSTFAGVIAGSGKSVTMNSGGTTLTLGGANTYTGGTTITAGTLAVNGSTSATGTVAVGTAGTLAGTGTVGGNATLTGNGIINLAAGRIAGTLAITGGNWNGTGSVTGQVTSSSGALTFGSNSTLTAPTGLLVSGGTIAGSSSSTINSSLNYTSSSASTFAGTIAGAGNTVTVDNSGGSLTLTGTNSYTGATTVTAGTLAVNGSTASGSAVQVNTGGTLAGTGTVNGNTTVTGGTVDLTGGTIGGTLTVNGTGGTFNGSGTVAGQVTSSSGTFTIGSGASLIATTGVNVTGGSIAAGNASSTITGNVDYTSATSSTFGGVIAGSGKTLILNNGAATLTLGGANTYTGATTVDAGTLIISGSTASGSAIAVDGGGTFSGAGTVGGVTGATGGTISGSGLTLTGLVTFNGTGNTLSGTETATAGIDLAANSSVTESGTQTGAVSLAAGTSGTTTLTGTGTVGAVTLAGKDTLSSTGTLHTGGVTVATNSTGNTIGAGAVTGAITQNSGSALAVTGTAGTDALANLATLSGTGTVGALTLAGNNTVSSTSTLTTGSISVTGTGNIIGGGGTVGASGTATTLNGAAALAVNGTLDGTLTVGTGALTGSGTVTGATSVDGGSVMGSGLVLSGGTAFSGTGNTLAGTVTSNVSLAPSGLVTQSGTVTGNLVNIAGTYTDNGTVTGSAALLSGGALSGTGHVGAVTLAGSNTLSSSGTLTTGGITVSGTGNLISSGSTIVGNTTLNSGALLAVNGTLTGTLGTGSGTLTGTGSVSGAVTVADGGTINAGGVGTTGTLTVGSITFQSGSTFALDLSGASTDKLTINGVATIDGGADISINASGLSQASYVLATASSGLTSGSFTLLGGVPSGYTLVANGTSLDLVESTATQTFTSPSPNPINIVTGSSTTVSASLNNTNTSGGPTVAVNLANNNGTGGTVTNLNSSSGATVGAGMSSTVTGTFTAGGVGTGKTWSISNTDSSATPGTITTGGAVNVYNHAVGTLAVTSPTTVNAITGSTVTSTLTFKNNGANNDGLTIVTPGTGVSGLSGTFAANGQVTTATGTTTAGAAGGSTSATYNTTYQEDQTVIGATPGNQTATSGTVTINDFNHASGVLAVTSATTVGAIAGTTINSTLTFKNNGADNDNLTAGTAGGGLVAATDTFTANQSTTLGGSFVAGSAGTTASHTYSQTWLEDQTVIGATAGNQTSTAAVTVTSYNHAAGVLAVTTPTTVKAITGTTINSSLTFTNSGADNDNLTAGAAGGGLTAATGTLSANQSTTLAGSFVAGAAGTTATNNFTQAWQEDQSILGATAGNQTSTAGVTVTAYNHAAGVLTVTSPTTVKAIAGATVNSTLSFENSGANNDNLIAGASAGGLTAATGTLGANQSTTLNGSFIAGAAGTTATNTFSQTWQEDQTVLGATAGNQSSTAGVSVTSYNHAVGVLTVTSPTTVKAITGTVVNSTLTFENNGANNDNLAIVTPGTGVTGLSGTFVGNAQDTTVNGATTAGAAGGTTSATYHTTYLEDQTVIGATAGDQTASAATVTISDYNHADGVLTVTSPTTLTAIAGTTIDSTLMFGNNGADNDNLIAGASGGGLTAATGTFTANQSTTLSGSFVAGAAGTTATNNFTQTWQEDQTVLGATVGNQTSTAGVTVTAVGHSVASLSSTTDDFGFVHEGATEANATTTLSNGTGDLAALQIVSLGGLADSGSGLIAAGTGRTLTAAINTGTVGAYNAAYTIRTEDNQAVVGATANANLTFTVSGSVYSGQGVWNTNGGGSWGTVNAPTNWTADGGAPGLDANFTTTDTATFGGALTTGNTAVVTLDGDNPSLKAITFNTAGSYTISQGAGNTGTITLNAGSGNMATINDAAGGNTISAPMVLATNTQVSVTNVGDLLTLSGNISGAGTGLSLSGAGTVLLSGNNTYTGRTAISSGTLMLGSLTALADSSAVTLSGGTLNFNGFSQTLNNFSSTGGTLTNTGVDAPTVVTFYEAADPVSSAAITGNMAVDKTGPGLLALTGANTYTGGTALEDGILETGSVTALGTGPVTNTGGTLGAYGAEHAINVGTALVTSNYTQGAGGNLVLNLTATPNANGFNAANDILDVTGTASLAGTLTLNFVPSSGFVPTKGQVFEVIATNLNTPGAMTGITGNFNTVDVNPPGFIVHTSVMTPTDTTGNDEYVTIDSTQLALATIGGITYTPNQTAIANYISAHVTSGTLFNLLSGVVASDPLAVPGIVDQYNPARFANFVRSATFNNAVFSTQELDSYLEGGRFSRGDFMAGNGLMDSSGLSVVDPSMDPSLAQVGSRLLAWSPAPIAHGLLSDASDPVTGGVDMKDSKGMRSESASEEGNNFSTFIAGNVVLAQNFSQTDLPHSDTTTGGVQIGADYRLTPHLRAGVVFGFSHTDGNLDNMGSKASIDSFAPGAYVSFADKGWYANAIGNYGFNSFTEDREVSIAGLSADAHGAPGGDQITGDLDGGYDFHVNKWTFGPLAGVQYTHLDVDSFKEDGAEALDSDLSIGKQEADSLRSRVGGHVSYVFQTGKVLLTPHLDASWQHEFMDQAQGIDGQFVDFVGTPFSVKTPNPSRDSALVDAGLTADLNRRVSVFGDYLIQAGQSNYFGQSVQAGVKIGF
jgi:fibronectin-binding autotransporter adhesin